MSVLIKMEMPKSCFDCPLSYVFPYSEDNFMVKCAPLNRKTSEDTKRNDCPLIEIPPHGRLIDADCCEGYFYEHMSDDMMIAAMNAINEMPTIIESESAP